MRRLLKILLYAALGLVTLVAIAAVAIFLFFDPNDFRDDIESEVERLTGRQLQIEGDLGLSLFPWLALDVGRARLGNAPGFGDEPFAEFEHATLSARLLPMLLRREFQVGTATLDGLRLNLAVAGDGRNNWDDLAAAQEEAPAEQAGGGALAIAGIELTNAEIRYADAQLGETYLLRDLRLATGRIAGGQPVSLDGRFDFALQPADLAGDVQFETVMTFDGDAGTLALDDIEARVLGVDIRADVSAFDIEAFAPVASFEVAPFDLNALFAALGSEPIETADPDALGRISLTGTLALRPEGTRLDELQLVVDETTFRGSIALENDAAGTISVELAGDRIVLDGYMAPPTDAVAADAQEAPVELPTELIRALNTRGNVTLAEASLAGMTFSDITLGFRTTGGKLRLHPFSAQLFGGSYEGDVRIDAAGAVPALSLDETIRNVDVGALARAMFDEGNVTGRISGTFSLAGRGADLAKVQQDLSGTMAFELLDGTYEGRDVWYELRRARAMLKKEPEPQPELPLKTRFSNVRLSGPVEDGVFRSDDLLAELPFMQLTGKGAVNLVAGSVDYRMNARVLERPELVGDVSAEELEEFTEATIPLRITGPLTGPSIKPDLAAALKKKAKEGLRDKLAERLLDGDGDGDGEESADGEDEEKDDKDKVRDALRDLLNKD